MDSHQTEKTLPARANRYIN